MTSNLDLIRGRQVVQTLTNKSGGAVIAGDVVIIDTANDESFTTTTTAAYNASQVGIALDSIASLATGRVLLQGYAPLVNVSASATRGYYLLTHTVAKQATSGASFVTGAFGQVLKAGTTPSAYIFPPAIGSSAGITRSGATTDLHLAIWNGSNADSLKDGGAVPSAGNYTGVPWSSGTSMPGTPATNQRVTRTDLGLDFFWNGTRWLSTTLYTCDMPPYQTSGAAQPLSASGTAMHRAVAMTDLFDMWVVDFRVTARVAATNDGSHYWTIELVNLPAGADVAILNTSAITAATVTRIVAAAGALVGVTNTQVYTYCSKVSTPGNLDILAAQFTYRLVGT